MTSSEDDLDLGPVPVHPLAGDPWVNSILDVFGVTMPGYIINSDDDPFEDRAVSGREIDDALLAAREARSARGAKTSAVVAKAVPRAATRSLPKTPGPGFGFLDEPPAEGEETTGTYAVEVNRKGKGPKKK